MKEFLKGEGVSVLTTAVSFFMALFVLEIFMCFAMVTKNKGLVITVLYMFLFVTVILCIVLLAQSGSLFLKRLRNDHYFEMQREKGDTPIILVGRFTILFGCFFFIMVALYLGMFGINIFWSGRVFPEEKEGLMKIWKTLFPGNGTVTLLVTVLEFITIAVLAIVLAVFDSVMSYNLFTKSRYAGILAAIFFTMLGAAIAKVNKQFFGALSIVKYHLASAAFCVALAGVLIWITASSIKKRNWKPE